MNNMDEWRRQYLLLSGLDTFLFFFFFFFWGGGGAGGIQHSKAVDLHRRCTVPTLPIRYFSKLYVYCFNINYIYVYIKYNLLDSVKYIKRETLSIPEVSAKSMKRYEWNVIISVIYAKMYQ